jgi:hypothetical protein
MNRKTPLDHNGGIFSKVPPDDSSAYDKARTVRALVDSLFNEAGKCEYDHLRPGIEELIGELQRLLYGKYPCDLCVLLAAGNCSSKTNDSGDKADPDFSEDSVDCEIEVILNDLEDLFLGVLINETNI